MKRKLTKKLLLMTVTFLFCARCLFSQEFNVKNYTVMDGLPSSTINGIVQDGNGRIWLATRNGISVYDGVNWKNYSKKDGLGNNEFIAISADKAGSIWGLAKSASIGLVHFTGDSFRLYSSEQFQDIPSDYTSNKCFAVYSGKNDTIAVLATGQAGIYYYKNGKWGKLTTLDGLPANEIRDIKEYDGVFHVVTSKGLATIDKNLIIKPFPYQLPAKYLNKLWSIFFEQGIKQEDSKLWLLGESFIGVIEKNIFSEVVSGIEIGEIAPMDYPRFYPGFHGLYFYGLPRNLFVYDENTKKTIFLSNQKNSVFTGLNNMIKDREDNLWIISNRGVCKIGIPKFTTLNSLSGLLKDEVSAITQMGNTMLFGHEEGITFWENGKVTVKKITDRLRLQADYRVMQFAKDKEGNVWFAAAKKGLGKIDKGHNIQWINLPEEKEKSVISVAADKNGKIYASTQNRIYRIEKNIPIRISTGIIDDLRNIRKIYITNKGNLLVCTMNHGLVMGNEKTGFKSYKSRGILTANSLYSALEENDVVYAGSISGLFQVSGDTLKKCEEISIDRPVYFIEKEKENYWIGTDFGVVEWHNGTQMNFTPHENLAGLETNRGGFFIDNKGNVWIGTDKGVSKYLEPTSRTPVVRPNLFVSFVDNEQKIIPLDKKIELDFSNNELNLSVNVVSFINENQNSYTAKLENFDTNWLPEINSSEKLRYTNLPPGIYRIRIKGKNALGIWSNEYISPEIIVFSPIYRRWWFILFVMASIVGLVYLIVGYLGRRKYAYKLEKEVLNRTLQLKESETKYKNLVTSMQEGVAVVQNNRVMYTNPAMASMIGYSLDELLGKEWSEFAYHEDIEMLYERQKLRFSGLELSPEVELRLKHKSGILLNVLANTSLITYEEAPAVFTTIKDITEQKAREVELVKLFTAVQQSPSAVIITGPSGVVEYVNPVFEKIAGYQKEEFLGKKTGILKSGLMPQGLYKDLWDTISAGKIWRGEILNKRKNKELFWVSASIAPIKNLEGEITNYIAVEEDITFEKYARQEIERKEKLLTATLEKAPIIIFILNKSGNFSFIKGNGLDLLGYSNPENLIGKHLSNLFGENEGVEEDLKRINMSQSFKSLRFASEFVYEVHFSPAAGSFDDDSASIGLAINITDYYNAEKTIKDSEAKIRAMLKAIPDFIFEINKDKIIIAYHEPADSKLKYPYGEIPGRPIRNVFPTIWPEIEKSVETVFETGGNHMKVFSFMVNRERKYLEARFVLRDEEKILAIVRDVTEKVLSERELIKAKEDAEKSDRLKSDFLAHMSHEIRTPVNTIMNFTSLMEEELSDSLSGDLKDGFRVIRDGGFRLIRTIDLILNMSQIQTGTYSPFYHKININQNILPSIIQEFHYRAKRKDIDLNFINNSFNSIIYGDDYTIGQIFANLIDNALKYTNHGRIDIVLSNRDNTLVAEVADTGIGISSEYLPRLFSPFTQEEMGYTRRFDGTGLGLALVKKYVEINNAQIFVESEKDKGTKFIVQFPLAKEEN